MGAPVSYKLKNSLQGALAGGGDPATSPLYVFGPFLALVVAAGTASITFGASIWLAVFTVVSVSATYRYVMKWVTDGSGGSGLSEEEFGSWAVKTNAAITVIEYVLTFLVSIAALVTFIADRFPFLLRSFGILNLRTLLAISLSLLVVWAVNLGPRISARFFGPATALILVFLWLLVFAVIWQRGLILPDFQIQAFRGEYLHFTLGGFARILALMTGIEIFANLVASYEGSAAERSRKAFGSLVIVMGTTAATMLIVGPAILALSDPAMAGKSVFTQTMDQLLPEWLSYAGTLIGIAVLLSAAAASTQGIQNLALGLRARHYIPARWGKRNRFDVPAIPSWIQGFVAVGAYLALGTHEETYLALYAAGVFILLSMTGWAAVKRFVRMFRIQPSIHSGTGAAVSVFSALCSSCATLIIFEERFADGAWSYLLLVPAIYSVFDFFRRRLGAPPESIDKRLSAVICSAPLNLAGARDGGLIFKIRKILVPLNGDMDAECAFHAAVRIGQKTGAEVVSLFVRNGNEAANNMESYLSNLNEAYSIRATSVKSMVVNGDPASEIVRSSSEQGFDLICMSSTKMKQPDTPIRHPVSYQVIYATTPPVLFLRPSNSWVSRVSRFKNILVPLDGSEVAEQILPYVSAWAAEYQSQVTLLSVPEEQGDEALMSKMKLYLEFLADSRFRDMNIPALTLVEGSGPTRTILRHLEESAFDLVAMVSHGRGGLDRQKYVPLGSVTESVFSGSDVPIFFISAIQGAESDLKWMTR